MLADNINFTYEVHLAKDGKFGSYNEVSNSLLKENVFNIFVPNIDFLRGKSNVGVFFLSINIRNQVTKIRNGMVWLEKYSKIKQI